MQNTADYEPITFEEIVIIMISIKYKKQNDLKTNPWCTNSFLFFTVPAILVVKYNEIKHMSSMSERGNNSKFGGGTPIMFFTLVGYPKQIIVLKNDPVKKQTN